VHHELLPIEQLLEKSGLISAFLIKGYRGFPELVVLILLCLYVLLEVLTVDFELLLRFDELAGIIFQALDNPFVN